MARRANSLYLKNLELVGFKSFAEKTNLSFEPGMTAIVGPNGCGKSNISDAIRWVLGEQSAKAMRGAKMEDVIFNGTDSHKPLSMAEVSLSLAQCESALGTEYDEVTITRRVLRSGEGQYFINKTPCRLKDLQRLFMDTGIGTNSYSLMEQGRIDQILSSRPEDRRGVFEEASGITKFKADKKEALRKLEQTEANLLRLEDIIREVRRRIISLQRQAGKAKRYKTIQDELRVLDIYLSKEKMTALASEITTLENAVRELAAQEEAMRASIQDTEKQTMEYRAQAQQKEVDIERAMEAASRAVSERDRTLQQIQINHDRITELRTLSERDSKDAQDAQARLEAHQDGYAVIERSHEIAATARDEADRELQRDQTRLEELHRGVEAVRDTLNKLRTESVDLDRRGAHVQNELSDLDAQERNNVMRRERLAAERAETQRSLEKFDGRKEETEQHLAQLTQAVEEQEARMASILESRAQVHQALKDIQTALSDLRARIAARSAQTQMVEQAEQEQEGLPPGARMLLADCNDPLVDRARILGTLAEHIQAEPAYQKALETGLRAWLDAVIVQDEQVLNETLRILAERDAGSARVICATMPPSQYPAPENLPGTPLLQFVRCSDAMRPMAERLLAFVRVVDHLDTQAPSLPPYVTCVTQDGRAFSGSGAGEVWRPGKQDTNPMTRRHLLAQWNDELNALQHDTNATEQTYRDKQDEDSRLEHLLAEARAQLDQGRHNLAVCKGELQVKAEEAGQARERLETVTYELNSLVEQQSSVTSRRDSITRNLQQIRERQEAVRNDLGSLTEQLRQREQERAEQQAHVTEKRLALGERRQEVTKWNDQLESLRVRMSELESLIRDRRAGLSTYQSRMDDLEKQTETARARVEPLEQEAQKQQNNLAHARSERETVTQALNAMEAALNEQRKKLDERRTQRSKLDVEVAEQRMRRQSIVERIAQDYHLTIEEMDNVPEPAWPEEGKPERRALESQVSSMRAKLESMGPVNLVAIEEHEELEERLSFLTTQQEDLVSAKTQLLDMIRKINRTTTELFTKTFDQVNINFQDTFKRLFGGGSAKLELIDHEDILESGIEIIARPPGKKLQTVSLLSGGERTMTAVALLFALYMVKPSPFCVLDELDAALDEANINRFVTMVEGFLTKSQFVVITHNRRTIEAADALYGVTMEKHGVSKIMSVKFQRHPEHDQATAERMATSTGTQAANEEAQQEPEEHSMPM